MEPNAPYTGKPFIGIQTTTLTEIPSYYPRTDYCLLNPETEGKISGSHNIPMYIDPGRPFWTGLGGLAATVVQEYGSQYEDKTTFEPPTTRRVGSEEHGFCDIMYKALSDAEKQELRAKADMWIARRK